MTTTTLQNSPKNKNKKKSRLGLLGVATKGKPLAGGKVDRLGNVEILVEAGVVHTRQHNLMKTKTRCWGGEGGGDDRRPPRADHPREEEPAMAVSDPPLQPLLPRQPSHTTSEHEQPTKIGHICIIYICAFATRDTPTTTTAGRCRVPQTRFGAGQCGGKGCRRRGARAAK